MAQGNTAVPNHGDHDRVAMLSLRADGTPDQTNPEMISDPEFARAATIEQFRQQAVSAVDQAEQPSVEQAEDIGQDPSIAERQKKHEDVAKAAESAAVKVVDDLFVDDGAPAGKSSTPGKSSTSSGSSSK